MSKLLEKKIKTLAATMSGSFGLACIGLEGGVEIFLDADREFPGASLVKIPIVVELYHNASLGELDLDAPVKVKAADLVGGAGVIQFLKPGHQFSLRELAWLAVVASDNIASNLLIDALGLERIEKGLERMGLKSTRIERKFMLDWDNPDRRNLTTPRDMVNCLAGIYHARFLGADHSQEVMEIMSRQQFTDKIPARLPHDLRVANKTGELAGCRHDAGVVFLPGAPYAICMCSENLQDEALADRILADISLEVFKYCREGRAAPPAEAASAHG